MCSVIEIKNANEYYIHYHSPESLPSNEGKKMEADKVEETTTKLKGTKDQEVTSDRGSSASPSLEDEDEQMPASTASNEARKSPSKESKIPVLKSSPKKLQAPQPPKHTFVRKLSLQKFSGK